MVKTFDLSTLQLSAGTHTIQVKARATGYRDSNFSNSVSYVVAADYQVSITYSSDGGHAEEYGTQYYSTDNGSTWIQMNQSSTIRATQIKFKTEISTLGKDGVYITITLNGTDVISTSTSGTVVSDNYVLSADATVEVYHDAPCFAENTKIKLADGTDKFVQDITYDDELLVWDFYEGKLAKAKPCWIKIEQKVNHYSKITLDNGIVMRLVGSKGHRLFSLDEQKMLYSNEIVGHQIYTLNGIATVLSCERVDETVKFYNLTTEKYLDCFADGVLTGSRLNNMYHISDMKYDSDVRLISEEEEAERWRVRERLRK